ncbi:MAG: hypothetical protein EZS28_040775 [Streblomastix strix]|uniref:PB1 domain-containing protein n=1 Tax=Streblomastix strix TaxID=222440 RepID=A0A5J4U030_9EUKA|nr:MAG: hypothetical protein EZS28_040775 [Streblomastix strix]
MKPAEFLSAIGTAHGLAADAQCFLQYMYENGDRIQITIDNDLAAALAQIQAKETFHMFVGSGENVGLITPFILAINDASSRI